MGQMLLPLFSEGATEINGVLPYQKKDGMVYYFHAGLPVFVHGEGTSAVFGCLRASCASTGVARSVS
jgi:hypothetical protein